MVANYTFKDMPVAAFFFFFFKALIIDETLFGE